MNNQENIERVVYPEISADGFPKTALSREFYTSEKWFARDIERVFSRRWIFVCHTSELPNSGDYTTFELGNYSVVVTRGKDSNINSFHNVCRHRGTRLCPPGKGKTNLFVCQFHGWSYTLDGSLRAAPHMPDIKKECFGAKPVWNEVWNGMVFINLLDEKPKPVAEYLRDADFAGHRLDNARVIASKEYMTKANWKINGETFQECYHCSIVHRDSLGKILTPLTLHDAYDNVGVETGDEKEFMIFSDDLLKGQFAPGVKSETIDGELVSKKLLGDDPNGQSAKLLSWFPNFSVGAWPDFAVLIDWIPVSAQETLFRTRWLVHADAVEGPDYDIEKVVHLMDMTNREDKKIVELQQAGVNSPVYVPGPYHQPLENDARKYIAQYLAMVQAKGPWAGDGSVDVA
ncbi:MAG: aromatic ring-hydroxylating oxygenase subunit alpha [Massilia sp.]